MNIILNVPARDETANPATITQPREMQEWVHTLPYANPLGTAKMLLRALMLLNRHPHRVPNRLKLMLLCVEPFEILLGVLRKVIKRKATVMSSRTDSQFQDVIELISVEMAYGFKRMVNNSKLLSDRTYDKEQKAAILFSCIHCLSLDVMFSFTSYCQEPRHAWREILQLYLLGEKLELARSSATAPTAWRMDNDSADVRLLFKRIILMNILDPFRLPWNEAWQIYDYLGHWSQHAKVSKPKEHAPENSAGLFLIDLRGAHKPRKFTADLSPEKTSGHLLIDISPLNTLINQHMRLVQRDGTESIPGMQKLNRTESNLILRRMLLAWHVSPERRHPREESRDPLVACCGINDIRHFLLEMHRPTPTVAMEEGEVLELSTITPANDPVNHRRHNWLQINISPTGAGLLAPLQEMSHLQVGMLILMHNEPGGQWKLGVIRRLIQRDENHIEMGVQFVQGAIDTARIRPVIPDTEEKADLQPALLLHRGGGKAGVIFTPHMIYKPAREYILEKDDGEVARILSAKLLESTGTFHRFEYQPVRLHGEET